MQLCCHCLQETKHFRYTQDWLGIEIEVARENGGEDRSIIHGDIQVLIEDELTAFEARIESPHSPSHAISDHKTAIGVAVIGPAIDILFGAAAKIADRQDDDFP